MKIAIVHDYLNQYGGAERVVEALHEAFPDAPVYTSIYLPHKLPAIFRSMDIRTSFMQKLPGLERFFKWYFLIYPKAFSSFNFSGYDIVLSSSSAFAKGITVPPGTTHISYCHTPARFIWRFQQYMKKEKMFGISKQMIYYLTRMLRGWDIRTAKNVHYFIANSVNTANKIKECYGCRSTVIYPPALTHNFYLSEAPKEYFLIVSRLAAYKRLDLVVEAFNDLKLPLMIIGDGPQRRHLEAIAKENIKFIGLVDDTDLAMYYSDCDAFIFPGEEDLGIAPIEAQASGRPVIAYAKGGALETVIDGETGVFFQEQSVGSIKDAVRRYLAQRSRFEPAALREHAMKFDVEVFKKRMKDVVENRWVKPGLPEAVPVVLNSQSKK